MSWLNKLYRAEKKDMAVKPSDFISRVPEFVKYKFKIHPDGIVELLSDKEEMEIYFRSRDVPSGLYAEGPFCFLYIHCIRRKGDPFCRDNPRQETIDIPVCYKKRYSPRRVKPDTVDNFFRLCKKISERYQQEKNIITFTVNIEAIH